VDDLQRQIEDAMWAGDVDKLDELAHCRCCCWEHTYGRGCPAYVWGGCRGQGTADDDPEGWARHYERFHDMTREQFFGWEQQWGRR
jgi:hypothetical protein